MLNIPFRPLAALLLVLWASIPAFSQATSGTIVGSVSDATGAVVANAKVTVTNMETKVSSVWLTKQVGEYTAPFLVPGAYQVAAEHPGFKRSVRNGVVIEIASKSRVDFLLELGALTDTVTAVGEAPLVRVDTSEVGQVIQDRPIGISPR